MDACFELLRRRRLAQLTQTQLADRAGVNISTVVRLERGHHRVRPDAETLRRLSLALDATVDDLFPELVADQIARPA